MAVTAILWLCFFRLLGNYLLIENHSYLDLFNGCEDSVYNPDGLAILILLGFVL